MTRHDNDVKYDESELHIIIGNIEVFPKGITKSLTVLKDDDRVSHLLALAVIQFSAD